MVGIPIGGLRTVGQYHVFVPMSIAPHLLAYCLANMASHSENFRSSIQLMSPYWSHPRNALICVRARKTGRRTSAESSVSCESFAAWLAKYYHVLSAKPSDKDIVRCACFKPHNLLAGFAFLLHGAGGRFSIPV